MNAIVQQSDDWHALRKNKIGASDAPVIMGVSPWKTPYQLWREKLSLDAPGQMTDRMQRGLALEDQAREKFMQMTGCIVQPQVLLHPTIDWMMASLDGISSDGKLIVEIKCPNRDDHAIALDGEVPEKYKPQLQHQMEVAGVDKSHYFSFDGQNGIIVILYRCQSDVSLILKEEEKFWNCVQNYTPPQLASKDYILREDAGWKHAAMCWKDTKARLQELEEMEKEWRDKLIELSEDKSCQGNGIRLCKIARKGNIDYSTIPELKNVDMEKYRKVPTEMWRLERC
jgi:putative phage-type endonuclease